VHCSCRALQAVNMLWGVVCPLVAKHIVVPPAARSLARLASTAPISSAWLPMRRGHAAAGVWAGVLPADAAGSVWHCAQLPQVAVAGEAGHLQVVSPPLGPWQHEHQVCMLVAAPCLPFLLAGNPCNPYSEQSGWLPWLGRMGAAHCGPPPMPAGQECADPLVGCTLCAVCAVCFVARCARPASHPVALHIFGLSLQAYQGIPYCVWGGGGGGRGPSCLDRQAV
jgi:hypothetical protein